MQHDEILNDPAGRHCDWRVTNWSSAVRTALGDKALIEFRAAFVVLLAPAVVLAAYSLYTNSLALILVLLSFWGFWTSSISPTGIGMLACMFVAIVGFLLGVIMQDNLLAYSAVLPGVTWLGSCAILGTTASYLNGALRKSEATFQVLIERGVLIATEIAEPSDAPKSLASREFES